MARRVLPVLLAAVAWAADAHGSHSLAFDALLASVPLAAVAALVGFGAYLEDRAEALAGVQAILWTVATGLFVLSCAARSAAPAHVGPPPLGRSALAACLGVFAIKGCVAVVPFLRRLAYRPAKP